MRLVTFSSTGAADARVGVLVEGFIADLTAAGAAPSMRALIEGGVDALARARDALATAPRLNASAARLLAPIPNPSKVLCSGINYRGHAAENPNAKMPMSPSSSPSYRRASWDRMRQSLTRRGRGSSTTRWSSRP